MSGYPPQDDDYEYDAREAFGHDFDAEMSRDLTPQVQGGSEGVASPGMDGIRDGAPFDDDMYDDMERERAGTPSPMQPESSIGSASMGSTSGASGSLSPSDMDYSDDDAGSPMQGMGGSSLDGSLLNSGFAGGPPQARDHMPTPRRLQFRSKMTTRVLGLLMEVPSTPACLPPRSALVLMTKRTMATIR
ncbi:hypothetical protein LTR17_009999 [Elasticomyces elasticus]|nr:hypothetical protein LTR17_009999 [Elasticomyces elasticus]